MTPDELLELIKKPEERPVFRLGTVSAISPSGAPFVKFDGESEMSEKAYSYIDSFSPVVGDRIILARGFGTYVALGKIMY